MTTKIEFPSLEEAGTYLFMEGFNDTSCSKAIRYILECNLMKGADRPKQINLVINSPGGSVTACFALIDTMKGSKIPVHTTGIGMIASCGLITFMAGVRGHRVITPNTAILSHQYSWGSVGKEHELFATMKEMNLTSRRILDHYKKCTGMSEKEIMKNLLPPEDVWLDAKEAVKFGIADRIVSTY